MRATLQIAAIGSPGENKTRLINLINSYKYRRKCDKTEFQFFAKDCSDTEDSSWKEFHYVIVIYDYDDEDSEVNARLMINNLCKTFCEPQLRICSVIVNERKDFSEEYMMERLQVRRNAFHFNVQTISVSYDTGESVDDLARHIVDVVHPQKPSGTIWTLHSALSWILDFLSKTLALPLPKNVNEDTPDLFELTDTDVNSLRKSPLAKDWDLSLQPLVGPLGSLAAHRITPTLLAKPFSASEVAALSFLRRHTTIPIPQPRYPHLQRWMVMDFIEGKMLIDCWPSLSFFMKLRVACTLRGYIAQLRRLRGDVPGRLGDGLVSGVQFEEVELGSFRSATHFRRYCEMIAEFSWNDLQRCIITKRVKKSKPPPPLVFGDDWDLVFTHADLNLTNILLADDGVLWIIDWGNSGFYPRWMESVTMQRYDYRCPKSWKNLRWLISGSFPIYEVFWDYVEQKVERFRRMSSVLQN